MGQGLHRRQRQHRHPHGGSGRLCIVDRLCVDGFGFGGSGCGRYHLGGAALIPWRLGIALGFVALLTIANLRGVRGLHLFALPTYLFVQTWGPCW